MTMNRGATKKHQILLLIENNPFNTLEKWKKTLLMKFWLLTRSGYSTNQKSWQNFIPDSDTNLEFWIILFCQKTDFDFKFPANFKWWRHTINADACLMKERNQLIGLPFLVPYSAAIGHSAGKLFFKANSNSIIH